MVGVRREILAMKSWHYWLFFVLGLIAPLWVASHQSAPGYMDAEYYFAGGLRLAQGHGFTEMMIWNYLAEPELLAAAAGALPRPSHVYWMPLASLLAAGGMYLTKSLEFSAARLGFLLVMGGVPALTAALAWQLKRRSDQAWLAGILATLPGLYLPFVATTDVFGLQMVLGAAFFWLILLYRGQRSISTVLVAGGMGILAGDGCQEARWHDLCRGRIPIGGRPAGQSCGGLESIHGIVVPAGYGSSEWGGRTGV